jgi:methylmalonyl-CoA mutase N-terminal domain/subunit
METDQRTVVGVNAFVEEDEHEIEILRIDESAGVGQRERLERLRAERDQGAVDRALVNLESAARDDENLMPPILDAARAYATLGEIRHTLEGVYGRFKEPVGF